MLFRFDHPDATHTDGTPEEPLLHRERTEALEQALAGLPERMRDILRMYYGDAMTLRSIATVFELLVPYERGDVLASVHREGEIVSSTHEDTGIRIRARLSEASAGRLSNYLVNTG